MHKKAVFFFISMAAIALAISACGKGFKTETPKAKDAKGVSVNATLNFNSLIDMAIANSPEVASLVSATTNRNSLKVDAKVNFAIPSLDPTGIETGHDSILRIAITVTSGDKSAIAHVSSNEAHLAVIAEAEPKINGYWRINGSNTQYPAFVGIDAVVRRNSIDPSGGYNLVGQLFSNFDNDGTFEVMAELNQNICEYVADASFISYFSEDGAPDCRGYHAE